MNAQNYEQIEIGLKSEVKRQVGLKNWEENVGNFNQRHLVNAWKLLYATKMTDEVTEMIWEFVLNTPNTIWKKMKSDIFGIYTTIGEYENKKGKKSLAHFTENRHYVGAVLKLGDKPIGYDGNFRVTKERFTLDLSKLPELQPFNGEYNLENLFQPIPFVAEPIVAKKVKKVKPIIIEESDDEDDIPISMLIEKKKVEKSRL